MRNTKIVATVGPATRSPEMLQGLLDAGVDVFRINASHGAHGDHATAIRQIRELAAKCGRTPGILLDLQGPKIRLGDFEGGAATLEKGARFTITVEPILGNAQIACTTYTSLPSDVVPGNRVLLADGAVALRALVSAVPSIVGRWVWGSAVLNFGRRSGSYREDALTFFRRLAYRQQAAAKHRERWA